MWTNLFVEPTTQTDFKHFQNTTELKSIQNSNIHDVVWVRRRDDLMFFFYHFKWVRINKEISTQRNLWLAIITRHNFVYCFRISIIKMKLKWTNNNAKYTLGLFAVIPISMLFMFLGCLDYCFTRFWMFEIAIFVFRL